MLRADCTVADTCPDFAAYFITTGTNPASRWLFVHCVNTREGRDMNTIIYVVGLIVIIMAILSFIGLS